MDLFGHESLPGLRITRDVITAAEEPALAAAIDEAGLAPFRFQGWLGKRLTLSFGWFYDFDSGHFARMDPIPAWLLPPRARAAAFAGPEREALVQALIIRYDPGAGIGWHRDRPVFEHVVGISLGAPAILRFRRRLAKGFGRQSLALDPRSIYHLSGAARHEWKHGIAPMVSPRWSITFRSLCPAQKL